MLDGHHPLQINLFFIENATISTNNSRSTYLELFVDQKWGNAFFCFISDKELAIGNIYAYRASRYPEYVYGTQYSLKQHKQLLIEWNNILCKQ